MTIPERAPLAVDYGLNQKRITALLELYREGTTNAHHATLLSLNDRGMVKFQLEGSNRFSRPYLTEHGKEVAQGLAELDDTEDEMVAIPAIPGEAEFVETTEPEDLTLAYAEVVSGAPSYDLRTATFQVLCRGRRSGEHSQLIAVVVGDEFDAQRVADQWNLAHLADIAARADATFAIVQPAEVGVYLFERFAVVEHP